MPRPRALIPYFWKICVACVIRGSPDFCWWMMISLRYVVCRHKAHPSVRARSYMIARTEAQEAEPVEMK